MPRPGHICNPTPQFLPVPDTYIDERGWVCWPSPDGRTGDLWQMDNEPSSYDQKGLGESVFESVGRFAATIVALAAIGGFGYWFIATKLKEDRYRSELRHEALAPRRKKPRRITIELDEEDDKATATRPRRRVR